MAQYWGLAWQFISSLYPHPSPSAPRTCTNVYKHLDSYQITSSSSPNSFLSKSQVNFKLISSTDTDCSNILFDGCRKGWTDHWWSARTSLSQPSSNRSELMPWRIWSHVLISQFKKASRHCHMLLQDWRLPSPSMNKLKGLLSYSLLMENSERPWIPYLQSLKAWRKEILATKCNLFCNNKNLPMLHWWSEGFAEILN